MSRLDGDDRLLRSTRALSAFIAPFLLVAFVLLYLFPGRTGQLWAWPIRSHMTSMLLASAYLGGCWFFLRVLVAERRWARVRAGFVAVAVFATLLGVATILHWSLFVHDRPAFWLWAGLYFTAPLLVVGAWLANQRYAAPERPEEPRLGRATRGVICGTGALAGLTGLFLFLLPKTAIAIWPWPLTPLTARVVGATFCLGLAGLAVLWDDRRVAVELMREVELVMLSLVLLAVVRARGEFLTGRPLTWVLGAGFLALLVVSAVSLVLDPAHRRPAGRHTLRPT